MLRFALALMVFFSYTHACKGGFKACHMKVKHSTSIQNNTIQIPLKNKKLLIFSKYKPTHAKILKYDPFLSLYLVEDTSGFKYPFHLNMQCSSAVAVVDHKMIQEGRIIKPQVGLNKFASFDDAVFAPAMMGSSCCALEGIVTNDGIIEREYVYRFVHAKTNEYSDIGIRVSSHAKMVVVSETNPFVQNNPFHNGDILLTLNGKKIISDAQFGKDILFAKVGSKHTIMLKRNGKTHKVNVITFKREGGGYLSDTFLEVKGLYFDDALRIKKVDPAKYTYGLKVGDKLIQVNGIVVKNEQELRKNISGFQDKAALLFERNSFQFFVHID